MTDIKMVTGPSMRVITSRADLEAAVRLASGRFGSADKRTGCDVCAFGCSRERERPTPPVRSKAPAPKSDRDIYIEAEVERRMRLPAAERRAANLGLTPDQEQAAVDLAKNFPGTRPEDYYDAIKQGKEN